MRFHSLILIQAASKILTWLRIRKNKRDLRKQNRQGRYKLHLSYRTKKLSYKNIESSFKDNCQRLILLKIYHYALEIQDKKYWPYNMRVCFLIIFYLYKILKLLSNKNFQKSLYRLSPILAIPIFLKLRNYLRQIIIHKKRK